jgi:membrane protease YdiL (CAAX protease family)
MTLAAAMKPAPRAQKTRNRRRDLVEFSVGYALILLVLWAPRWQKELCWLPLAWIATVTWLGFNSWGELGLRTTNFVRSFWIVIAAALLSAASMLLAAHLGTLNVPQTHLLFFKRYIGYAIWSFVQQFLVLDFFLWRLLRLLPGARSAAIAAALLFAIAHIPSPILMIVTLVFGWLSCVLFLRYRNLYPLAMAHAILGITIAITIPGHITHNMRVGIGYLTYRQHPHHHHHEVLTTSPGS